MVNRSIVSIFDKLSVQTVLSGQTGSIFGFVGTLAFIAVCLIILIPPIHLYNIGSYFESQFVTDQYPKNSYTTGKDFILAVSFRNRITNEYANHAQIQQKLIAFAGYTFAQKPLHKIDLVSCNQQLFKNGINPITVNDCLMMPSELRFNIQAVQGYYPYITMSFSVRCDDPFQCTTSSPFFAQKTKFLLDLNKYYYYELIFSSKVIDDNGYPANQFHKVYSSQYNSPDSNNTIMAVRNSQKQTFVDNSIMPWWNNNSYTGLYWTGRMQGIDRNDITIISSGLYVDFMVQEQYRYSYRYYKKLDFILGMIGGAIFLLYIIFWLPFSYINRTLQKIKYTEQLYIDRDQQLQTINNFKKVSISFTFFFNNILPFQSKQKDLVKLSQNQVSIVNLIRKLKVSYRNIKANKVQLNFKPKDIDFSSEQIKQNKNSGQQNILGLNYQTFQALQKAPNSQKIFSTQPAFLALKSSSMLSAVLQDDKLQKIRQNAHNLTFKQKIFYNFGQIIKFFDIFGAKPMLNAQPQSSSCWGFILTIIITILSILTVALTIYNMDTVKIVNTFKYQSPQNHYYQMETQKNLRFAICLNVQTVEEAFNGPSKIAQLTFFKHSNKYGYQQIQTQIILQRQIITYFQLDQNDPRGIGQDQKCFKAVKGITIPFGGTHDSMNQAYFGIRMDPYCMGTPQQCLLRKNQTLQSFVQMTNMNKFALFINQNKYSPKLNRIIPGVSLQLLSQSLTILQTQLKRTQTIYLSSIELIEDKSKGFSRQQPRILQKTVSAYQTTGDNDQQKKGDPNSDPAYILQFRPNGKVNQVILRTYKIDYLLGIIGGTFLFWYFVINLFAKLYNSFKYRAKMAELLYQQDSYNQSLLVCFLHLTKIPSKILCCSGIKQDLNRMKNVDQKIKRDLNLINLVKKTQNCYYLSSSLFHKIEERNLSLIYFRQKIDQSQKVKRRRQNQQQNQNNSQFDQYGSLDDEIQNTAMHKTKNQIFNQNQANDKNNSFKDLQKILPFKSTSQTQPLYDSTLPVQNQHVMYTIAKKLDLFKNPPQLTLEGERDVKSIIGGICFFINFILIIIVVSHFIGLYLSGADFTISHTQFRDENLSLIQDNNSLQQLNIGIDLLSGDNFKLAVSFHKKDKYYPFDVSSQVGISIGVRIMQFTVKKINGQFNQTFTQVQLESCRPDYALNFLSKYNDREIYGNLTNAYCLPNNVALKLRGIPQDMQRQYFKLSVYNKYKNTTGADVLNNFFRTYIPQYYMSVPIMDYSRQKFHYQMKTFAFVNDIVAQAYESNLTMTKIQFTDKYSNRNRQTYNDKVSKRIIRSDSNLLTTQYTRNVTFYYTGMIDKYTLDYPGGGQLFGLVGGVIALFTFLIYSFALSFNHFKMKYMIGQRLYSLDKKTSIIYKDLSTVKKSNKRKTNKMKLQQMRQKIRRINNFNQLQLFFAWILNPFAYIKDNFNYPQTLRYVTLIVQKVQQDINIYNFYQKLQTVDDALNSKIILQQSNLDQNAKKIKLTSVYFKKIYHQQRIQRTVPSFSALSKKHKLSSFEQMNIEKALVAKVNPEYILGDKVLNNLFGLGDNTSILQSRFQRQSHDKNSDREQQNSRTLLGQQDQSYGNLHNQFTNSTIIEKKKQKKNQQQNKQEQVISSFEIQ